MSRLPYAPSRLGALVVGHDEKDVGAVLGCGAGCEQGCQGESCVDRAEGHCSPQHIWELYPIITFRLVGGGPDKRRDVNTALDQHPGDRRSPMVVAADD